MVPQNGSKWPVRLSFFFISASQGFAVGALIVSHPLMWVQKPSEYHGATPSSVQKALWSASSVSQLCRSSKHQDPLLLAGLCYRQKTLFLIFEISNTVMWIPFIAEATWFYLLTDFFGIRWLFYVFSLIVFRFFRSFFFLLLFCCAVWAAPF